MIIGVDFDGTIVSHEYPIIGEPNPGAIEILQKLLDNGHQLILWTMRSGDSLKEVVQYLTDNNIELFGINENPKQKVWTQSPKAYCQIYIDDAALGCPLKEHKGTERPWVNWVEVRKFLNERGLI